MVGLPFAFADKLAYLCEPGYFNCRFMPGIELAELGKFIKSKAKAGHDALFVIKEEGDSSCIGQEVRFDSHVINRMINRQMFRMDRVGIRRSNRATRTDICLCFAADTLFPISGFPRALHDNKPAISGKTLTCEGCQIS